MSTEEPTPTNEKDHAVEAAGTADQDPGTERSTPAKSPVEDIDATPEGLKDAPALEEEEDSPVAPENS